MKSAQLLLLETALPQFPPCSVLPPPLMLILCPLLSCPRSVQFRPCPDHLPQVLLSQTANPRTCLFIHRKLKPRQRRTPPRDALSRCNAWPAWNSLSRPSCLQTHRASPASASQIMGSKVCTTRLGPERNLLTETSCNSFFNSESVTLQVPGREGAILKCTFETR